jgi:hypothetical protein
MSTSRKLARITSLLLAGCFGVTLGACGPHSEYRINKVCKRYCQRVFDCNDNTDYEDCVDTCIDDANGCESDSDVEVALDILDDCAAESCNDVGACTLEAWLECNL